MNFKKAGIIALAFTGLLACKKNNTEPQPQQQDYDRTTMLRSIADNVIIPDHNTFQQQAGKLSQAIKDMAGNPTTATVQAAQHQWAACAKTWASCEVFNFGEVVESYTHNKIYTWPCNEVFITKYVYGTDSLTQSYVATKGSSSKGLAAIEFLIFDSTGVHTVVDSLTNSPYGKRRCSYLVALGEDLQTQAAALNNMWSADGSDYYNTFINSSGTGLGTGTNLLINAMTASLETMLHTKLGKPMGKQQNNEPQVYLEEAYRSREALDLLMANLGVLEQTFHGGQDKTATGIDDYLDAVGAQYDDITLSQQIDNQLATVRKKLTMLAPDLSSGIVNNRPAAEEAYTEMKALLVLFKVDVVSNLGITLTLNDNDGD